jgi:hypothetical protein
MPVFVGICQSKLAGETLGVCLALALLVTWVLADDHYSTVTANYLALVANLLDAWVNLHVSYFS